MDPVRVSFGSRPGRSRRPVRRLAGLLTAQAALTTLVVAYALAGGAMKPDHGLEQLGLLSLDERVPGLAGTGRAALVVVSGTGPACERKVAEAADRRDRPLGLPTEYDLVVLQTSPDVPGFSSVGTQDRPGIIESLDLGGELARRLALSRALTGCHPGYAVMTPDGVVRYRTYDDDWQRHGGEQMTLLQAVD